MNTRHKNLKFTLDFEQNNSLSFLDIKITCRSKGFSTSVFHKTMFPGVFKNFDSLIVSFLSLIKQVLFLHYCFAVSQFALICKVLINLEVDQLQQIFKCNN